MLPLALRIIIIMKRIGLNTLKLVISTLSLFFLLHDASAQDLRALMLQDSLYRASEQTKAAHTRTVKQAKAGNNVIFNLQREWITDNTMFDSRIPLVGDVDNDGLTEVVVSNNNATYIVDGVTGRVENQIGIGTSWFEGIAMADVDKDGYAEIFLIKSDTLVRIDYDGTDFTILKEEADITSYSNYDIAIADFNQDGTPEVYVDGNLFTIDLQPILNINIYGGFPVAADIFPDDYCTDCKGLELVTTNAVFAVDIEKKRYIEVARLNQVFYGYYPSIADMNNDGSLDIVISGSNDVVIWNPYTKDLVASEYTLEGNMGRANIADFDNDGVPEIGVAAASKYIVLEVNEANELVEIASAVTQDRSSGVTGSSVYDFDGDGANEIVYRDEINFYIYRLNNGQLQTISSIPCRSGTWMEYPVVVDVDNDGETEILCACQNHTRTSASIVSISASNVEWVEARNVWNQHSYFNVNVNNDLTIPSVQLPHHLLGNEFNNFLVQATQESADNGFQVGCKDIAIDVTNASVKADLICEETLLILEYDITNHGEASFFASTPITYGYQLEAADAADISKWETFVVDLGQKISPNESIHVIDSISYQGTIPHTVHIALNTDNIEASPSVPSSYRFEECNSSEDVDPILAYENNHAKIENIADIATINSYARDMALDLSTKNVTAQCENEQLTFQYDIINKGEVDISSNTPITYVYITDNMGVKDTTYTIRYISAVIPAGETHTQTDAIELKKEEFELYVILNSTNPRASTTNLDLFSQSECDAAGTATPESIYADNIGDLGSYTPCDYCERNMEIILDDIDIKAFCDEDKMSFEYKIANTGNSVFSSNTPITYAYQFIDSLGNVSAKTPFVSSLSETLYGYDTIVQTDYIDYHSIPSLVHITLNTNNVNASSDNADDYAFLECPAPMVTTSPYEDNYGKIEDVHEDNKCCLDAKIDLSNAQVIGLCDEDKIIFQYEIINEGNMTFTIETPITYEYTINNINDENADRSRVHFVRNFDQSISTGESFTQIDTIPFRGVPFNTYIKINTDDVAASPGKYSSFYFSECDYNSLDDSKIYRDNIGYLFGLDTCKQMKAYNDTIYIKSNDFFEWGRIFDNDSINFSATTYEGVKHNFKEYIATITANQFAAEGAILSNEYSDTVGVGNAYFSYQPSDNYTPDSILVDSFQYKVCHSTITDLCDSAWVFIHYTFEVETPPQGFTANNGTGWEVANYTANAFPNSRMQIFNRWGNKVYDVSPYNNDWDGTSNAGNELPVGTYYYIFDKGAPGTTIETGFVYLNRE